MTTPINDGGPASDTPVTDRLEYEQECNFDVGWEDACRRLERENVRLRGALKTVLASAHPHPMENGAMYEAWEAAKKVMSPVEQTMRENLKG